MAVIAVLGGTGYAGRHIVKEAVDRGHTVLSIARNMAAERVPGATYVEASLLDVPDLVTQLQGVDVVVSAVAPRGDMLGKVRPAIAELNSVLPGTVRLGIVGGAGGSHDTPGGPLLVETPEFPADYKAESLEALGILQDLQADASGRDWFYVHPAGGFGSFNPGERTGTYRTGGDVLVVDDAGQSNLSGADLAVAIVDEIETPAHVRDRFTVGY